MDGLPQTLQGIQLTEMAAEVQIFIFHDVGGRELLSHIRSVLAVM